MIEFLNNCGFIKCTESPQLFFNMTEVVEKKMLQLNEKVEFSIAPVSLLHAMSSASSSSAAAFRVKCENSFTLCVLKA